MRHHKKRWHKIEKNKLQESISTEHKGRKNNNERQFFLLFSLLAKVYQLELPKKSNKNSHDVCCAIFKGTDPVKSNRLC